MVHNIIQILLAISTFTFLFAWVAIEVIRSNRKTKTATHGK